MKAYLSRRRLYLVLSGAIMTILILSVGISSASSVTIRPTGLLVPLYTPAGDATWSTLIQVKSSYPSVPVIAIINPSSGSGNSLSPTFVSGIQSLQTAGINVVGYIPTHYTATSISVVESGIMNYSSWYHVNGIFFDQMSNIQANLSYYSTVSTYAHSLGLAITIGNPGTSVPASFVGSMNILNIYENSGDPNVSTISSAAMGYDRSNFAMIAYNVTAPTQTYLNSVAPYVSYVYFTDGNGTNPFTGLTSYLDTLFSELLSIDGPVTFIDNLAGLVTLGNNDSTLTFNTGVSHITVTLNLGHANTWTAVQTFLDNSIAWSKLTLFPPACPGNEFITTLANNPTCASPRSTVSVTKNPSNPTGTAQVCDTVKMMGLGAAGSEAMAYTPTKSGLVRWELYGAMSNTVGGDGVGMDIRRGTGTAPNNGDAATGTAYNAYTLYNTIPTNGGYTFFDIEGTAQLTVGTTYWFDTGLCAITGGTAAITHLHFDLLEFGN